MSPEPQQPPLPLAAVAERKKISDRRQAGLRRRAGRMAARIGVLVAIDVSTLFAVRSVLAWMTITQWPAVEIPGDFGTAGPLSQPGEPASMVFWIAALIALAVTGSYRRYRRLNAPVRLAAACLLAGAAASIPLAAVVGVSVAFAQLAVVSAVAWLALLAARGLSELFLRRIWPREIGAAPALLLGPEAARGSTHARAITAPGGDYRIAAHHQPSSSELRDVHTLARVVNQLVDLHHADAVVVTEDLSDRQLGALITSTIDAGCMVLVPPRAVQVEGVRPRLVWHYDQPFLEFATLGLQVAALFTKRITDVIGASIILLLAAPVMLLIAIGIKLDSPGPVLFSQLRAGLGGRSFRMLKFRTMRASAEREKGELAHLNHTGDVRLFKIPEDPRVTSLGRILRLWSLDELPQLWNVLRGEMSLIGPRPFFESDFESYEEHHFRRLDTKPGITGLWQVSGRSDVVKFDDVVYLDRQYIENWSMWLDLSILLRTVPSVIRRKGAY